MVAALFQTRRLVDQPAAGYEEVCPVASGMVGTEGGRFGRRVCLVDDDGLNRLKWTVLNVREPAQGNFRMEQQAFRADGGHEDLPRWTRTNSMPLARRDLLAESHQAP